MKLLIIGASGVLGSRLYNDTIKKKWDVAGTYCSHKREGLLYLDVTDKGSVEKAFNLFRPEVVVMAGGITNVDLCAVNQKLADDVNIKGTLILAKKIKEYGLKIVYVSTDYIFDGKDGPYAETDKPNPVNRYGKTKLEAENIIRGGLKDFLIVRTSQLYGAVERSSAQDNNFAVKIIHSMRSGKKVYAADDFYSTPTYSGSLSEMIIRLVEKKSSGIYHGAGKEFINRYEYVSKIADIFKLDKALIQRVKLKDLKLKAKRPERGGLRINKIKKEKDIKAYDCKTGLMLLKKQFSIV